MHLKHTVMRFLSLCLAAGLTLPLFVSCQNPLPDTPDDPTETPTPTEAEPTPEVPGLTLFADGKCSYRIVRGETAEKDEVSAAVSVRKALMAASGLDVTITTDWDDKKDNADIKEILIGNTNRAESAAALSELTAANDFIIKVDGNKIVILGGSSYATEKAATAFVEAYVTGRTADYIGTPATLNYLYIRAEHLSDLYLDEENIQNYELCTTSVLTNTQNLDKDYLYKNTGAALADIRFADCSAEIIYRFVITDMIQPKISLSVLHAFTVEVSETPDNWQQVVSAETGATTYYCVIDPFEYGFYDTVFVRLTDPTPEDGGGAAIANFNISYYKKGDMTQSPYYLTGDLYDIVSELSEEHDPVAVEGYRTAEDGGLIYDRLSRENADELDKYDGEDTFTGTLTLKDRTLTYSVPKAVTAYDMVPVQYTITTKSTVYASAPLHFSVTGQEDADRENGNLYYDLNLPGSVDLAFTYDGYVRANGDSDNKPVLNTDFTGDRTAAAYPDYEASELCLSGNIEAADYVWFHFTYTNIGNTVLDGDGNGTFCFEPFLYKKSATGAWEKVSAVPSMYLRIVDEVYPGESGSMWVYFPASYTDGEYYVQINCIVRNEIDHPEVFGRTIWGGETPVIVRQSFTVDGTDRVTKPEKITKTVCQVKRNKWLHYYEEFQSSYLSCLKMKAGETQSGTLYVQLSPWCNQLVLKLIDGDGDGFEAVSLPIDVESDSLSIQFNPDNPSYVVLEDGTRFPAIMTQSMADMRVNVENDPDTAGRITEYLAEIKDLGINIVNTTAGFAYDNGVGGSAFKFSVDVARKLGLKVEGFISYPYTNDSVYATAASISKESLNAGGVSSAALAKANAVLAEYQFLRWGDTYWVTNGNTTVLSVEDTRGGANITGSTRHLMDSNSKQNFTLFLRSLYGDIEALNFAWDSEYTSFSEIDPEAEAVIGSAATYDDAGIFRQWSQALSDLDCYRTLERSYSYKTLLAELAESIPGAKLDVRLEGDSWICKLDPDSTNIHYRLAYYNQRYNAIIPEILAQSQAVYCFSDYVWTCYSPEEVAYMSKSSLEDYGIVSAQLPLFNRFREVVINESYGQDMSAVYNITGKAVKGIELNTTASLYEWWKATYENGGIPGILWSDYLCDGYATATQRREIAFFIRKLTEAMDTEEGRAWATNFTHDESVLNNASGFTSYDNSFVEECIRTYYDSVKAEGASN